MAFVLAMRSDQFSRPEETEKMSTTEQDRWSRVKGRLKAELGDDVYTSWFARVDLEGLDNESVRLSVPTRFLKSWIQAHYAEKVLACWQSENTTVTPRNTGLPRKFCW